MSYRMDNWLANTGSFGNDYLVSRTGMTRCGGSDVTSILSTVLGAGMSIASTAIAAKQASSAQATSSVNAMTLAHTALAQAGVVDTAITEYEDAKTELTSLQERQAAVKEVNTLKTELETIEKADGNSDKIEKYTELKANIDNLTRIQKQATTIQSQIAELQRQADAPVSTALPNGFVTITGDGSNAMQQVTDGKSKYGTGDSFNQVAFDQDMAAARDIQTAAQAKLTAKQQLEDKKAALQDLKNMDGGNLIQGEVTIDSIQNALVQAQSDLSEYARSDDNKLKNGDKTISLLQYNDKLGKYNKAQEDADVDFDSKIKAQNTIVETKKKAVVAQKATLKATRSDLARLAQSMQSVITEQGEADSVKTARDNYNKSHKRGFFRKLFGTGKDATQKANDKSYKKEMTEAKAASATFAQAYSFQADAAGLQIINEAIKEIDTKLATIATIEAETTT